MGEMEIMHQLALQSFKYLPNEKTYHPLFQLRLVGHTIRSQYQLWEDHWERNKDEYGDSAKEQHLRSMNYAIYERIKIDLSTSLVKARRFHLEKDMPPNAQELHAISRTFKILEYLDKERGQANWQFVEQLAEDPDL